jgi:hypothetical protein
VVVENPDHVAKGIALLMLDGAPITSNVVDRDTSIAETHELHVRLGAKNPTNGE